MLVFDQQKKDIEKKKIIKTLIICIIITFFQLSQYESAEQKM